MNAHYVAWNCEEMDKNGENLYEEFGEKDLFVINHDTLSKMGESGQKDLKLDLVFGSINI